MPQLNEFGANDVHFLKPGRSESMALATLGIVVVILALYEMLRQSKNLRHAEFLGTLNLTNLVHSSVFGFVLALIHIVLANLLVDHWSKILHEPESPAQRALSGVLVAHMVILALSVSFARLAAEVIDLKYPSEHVHLLFGDGLGVLAGGLLGLVITQSISIA